MDFLEALKLIAPWLLIGFGGMSGMLWFYRKRDVTRMDEQEKKMHDLEGVVLKLQMASELAIKGNGLEINQLRNEMASIKNELHEANKEIKNTTHQLITVLSNIRKRDVD